MSEVLNTIRVKAFKYVDGTKVNEYAKPDEVYFSKSYGKTELMEVLFNGIEGPLFLSPYYLNREKTVKKKKERNRGRQRAEYSWKKFFEIMRTWSSPRVVKNEGNEFMAHDVYNWREREAASRGHGITGAS